ncbi:MAG: polysaccharide deacetylase family protein [Terriglobia bacterium]|jgi:peptidoglycan/xylan/chitin deacetylase (PgdA/CDA1 family)|nr:polysaccharide deacetylase family protein [Terriglobia bacterium]
MLKALLGTAAVCGAATFAGLESMVPTWQLYGRSFVGLPKGAKQLALTYDDGPNDPYTGQLLDVLAKANVKATFFLIGRYVKQGPDIVRRVVEAGHAIGNHTWNHPNLIWCSPAETRRQLADTQKAVEDACGITPTLFRPPFGGRRPGTFQAARAMGLEPIMWRVTCYDWSAKSNESIEQKAHAQIRGGDVILLHDGSHVAFGISRAHTVKATENLVREYSEKGYEFVSVPEMMGARAHFPVLSSQ